MKIGVATHVVGERYRSAVALGIESKIAYCRRHGYEFILSEQPLSARLPSWDKIPLLSKNIDRFDAIFWSDADVLITNPERRLSDIIDIYDLPDSKTILISKDAADNVNSGNFFLFNRPVAKSLLERIWQQEQFCTHPWWENMAIIHLLQTDPEFAAAVHVELDRPNLFNAYVNTGDPARNYRPGDLLIHFAGVGDPGRIELLMKRHHRRARWARLMRTLSHAPSR